MCSFFLKINHFPCLYAVWLSSLQLAGQDVMETCFEQQLCMIAFLPHILDSMAVGRNGYIQTLLSVAEHHKTRSFGYAWSSCSVMWIIENICMLCRWVWLEGGQNADMEQSYDVGGFGYPVISYTTVYYNFSF